MNIGQLSKQSHGCRDLNSDYGQGVSTAMSDRRVASGSYNFNQEESLKAATLNLLGTTTASRPQTQSQYQKEQMALTATKKMLKQAQSYQGYQRRELARHNKHKSVSDISGL